MEEKKFFKKLLLIATIYLAIYTCAGIVSDYYHYERMQEITDSIEFIVPSGVDIDITMPEINSSFSPIDGVAKIVINITDRGDNDTLIYSTTIYSDDYLKACNDTLQEFFSENWEVTFLDPEIHVVVTWPVDVLK